MPQPSIPPSIELAWGLREPGSRGPKRGLTLEAIVAAGIHAALSDGLESLSMGRVAKELGVGTMSLYRYVASKDELLTLMVDAALGPPADSPQAGQSWRNGMTQWAVSLLEAYRRHPWALKVPINAPPLGPNNVAWLEWALRTMAQTPLSEQQKLSSVLLISGFVRNDATLTADFAAGRQGETVIPGYGALLSQVIEPSRFPALERAIASGALDDEDDPDREFRFGLERVLDGIELLIGQTDTAGRRPSPWGRRP